MRFPLSSICCPGGILGGRRSVALLVGVALARSVHGDNSEHCASNLESGFGDTDCGSREVVSSADVIVVGAGPTGLYSALLLGEAGIKTIVLERAKELRHHGGATNLHAETLCNLQRAGLDEFVNAEKYTLGYRERPKNATYYRARPQGIRLLFNGQRADDETPDNELLTYMAGRAEGAFALPTTALIYQGDLEEHLLARVRQLGSFVTLLFGKTVSSVKQDTEGVRVEAGGELKPDVFIGKHLLAADGASSFVRSALEVKWLERDGGSKRLAVVYDLKSKTDTCLDKVFYWHGPYVECTAERPMVFMPMPRGIFRYLTWPSGDETHETMTSRPFITNFLKERVGIELDVDVDLDRAVPYWLRHRVTEDYVVGRTIFLGDAAHVMGPFLGQGLCQGLRDVSNVVWKLSLVLKGKAPETLLATVRPELAPIAEKLVAGTKMVMDAAHTRSPFFARFRDAVIKYPMRMEMSTEGEVNSWRASDHTLMDLTNPLVIVSQKLRSEAAGKLFVQPYVMATGASSPSRLFAGIPVSHFIVIGFNADPQAELAAPQLAALTDLGVSLVCLNVHGQLPLVEVIQGTKMFTEVETGEPKIYVLPKWLAAHDDPTFVVIRPDLYIFAGAQSGKLNAAVDEMMEMITDATQHVPAKSGGVSFDEVSAAVVMAVSVAVALVSAQRN